MILHEVLAAKRGDVLQHWKALVRGTLAPEAMPPFELLDHVPRLVDEIIAALSADAGLLAGPMTEESSTAAGHGAQRFRLGFSLDSVVREYGALKNAITATAAETGTFVTTRELHVVCDALVSGIAQAVSEYTRQRDAELLRQSNEHFAFIAHELRNPLSSVMIAFELLKQKAQLPEESRSVAVIERGLKRAINLIEQTLRIARFASGIELHYQATTLAAIFDEVELGSVSEAESKGITIHVTIENDEVVTVDPRLLSSALGNLLRNGVKYTPPGGLVELRGRIAKGHAYIEVEDACGGLPPGRVEEAFAPFVRLDARESGFGLGLAIAKQAIDAHGGNLRIQNLPGKGCIFAVELPVAARSP